MKLICPNCLNPFKVRKVPKGFIEASTKCPSCEITILRRANPNWSFIKKNDYFLGIHYRDTLSLNDNISYNQFNDIDNKIDTNDTLEKINKLLTPVEKRICELKKNGYTYKEIGEEFGVSKQRIEQRIRDIRRKALDFL